jgi:polyribonucleotide 5'-hydroxyl-kinase
MQDFCAKIYLVNVILVLGAADKVFKELKSRFGNAQPPGHISVIRLDKSGGCVDRDESYMRELRQAQIREYFYGHGSMSLTPFTQVVDFHQIAIYRIADESSTSSGAFDPGAGAEDEEDDEYDPMSAITNTSGLHDRIPPTLALQNAVLAVTHADANANSDQIRDASVMCYVYVADVDDTKRRLKLLSPINGRIPSNALVWGQWPEGVSSLVA